MPEYIKFIALDWDDTLTNKSHMDDFDTITINDQVRETTPLLPGAVETLNELSKNYIIFIISDRDDLAEIRIAQLRKYGISASTLNENGEFDKNAQVVFTNTKSLSYLLYLLDENRLVCEDRENIVNVIGILRQQKLLSAQKGRYVNYLQVKTGLICAAYIDDDLEQINNARELGIRAIHANSKDDYFRNTADFFQNKVLARISGTLRNEIISLIATAKVKIGDIKVNWLTSQLGEKVSTRLKIKEAINQLMTDIQQLPNDKIQTTLATWVENTKTYKRSGDAEKMFRIVSDLSTQISMLMNENRSPQRQPD